MNILLTGAAGFIGFHVAKQLIKEGHYVIGVDDFNRRLYDSSLKYDRVKQLGFTDEDIEIIKYPKLHNNIELTRVECIIICPRRVTKKREATCLSFAFL